MSDGEMEYRIVPAELRVDQGAEDFRPVIRGYAVVFGSLSENLGGFRERIRPEAVRRTLEEKVDVRALVDHDAAKIMGRRSVGTLRLKADGKGLRVEIDPPNTTYARDIIENIRRGDVSGMSFAMPHSKTVDKWDRLDDGMPVRDVLDTLIREVSLVTFPAYTATVAEVTRRSLQAFQVQAARKPVALLLQEQQAKMAQWR